MGGDASRHFWWLLIGLLKDRRADELLVLPDVWLDQLPLPPAMTRPLLFNDADVIRLARPLTEKLASGLVGTDRARFLHDIARHVDRAGFPAIDRLITGDLSSWLRNGLERLRPLMRLDLELVPEEGDGGPLRSAVEQWNAHRGRRWEAFRFRPAAVTAHFVNIWLREPRAPLSGRLHVLDVWDPASGALGAVLTEFASTPPGTWRALLARLDECLLAVRREVTDDLERSFPQAQLFDAQASLRDHARSDLTLRIWSALQPLWPGLGREVRRKLTQILHDECNALLIEPVTGDEVDLERVVIVDYAVVDLPSSRVASCLAPGLERKGRVLMPAQVQVSR
jgi:hypothetical protein